MILRYLIVFFSMAFPSISFSQNYDAVFTDNPSEYFRPEESDYLHCMTGLHRSNLRKDIATNNAIADGTHTGPALRITPDDEFDHWVQYLEALSWNCITERQNAAVLTAEKLFGVEQARNANLVEIGDKIEARLVAYFYYFFVIKPKQE